jgi:hypothetical protein
VNNASGDDESQAGFKLDGSFLKVDKQQAFDGEEELVVVVVLVPVVLAFDEADADYRIVDLAEGLVEPLVILGVRDGVEVDAFEGVVEDVEASFIGEGSCVGHGKLLVARIAKGQGKGRLSIRCTEPRSSAFGTTEVAPCYKTGMDAVLRHLRLAIKPSYRDQLDPH